MKLAITVMEQDGRVLVTSPGEDHFRAGEFVTVRNVTEGDERVGRAELPAAKIELESVMKHSITRGVGAFEHQSAEPLISRLSIPLIHDLSGPAGSFCDKFKLAWNRLFDPATGEEIAAAIRANPTGVFVDELKSGMSTREVEAILGAPERKASIAFKVIYFYPRMKLTFIDNKLQNVE